MIKNLDILFTSLVDYNGKQKINITCETTEDIHGKLRVSKDGILIQECSISFINGYARETIMLPAAKENSYVLFTITDTRGDLLFEDTLLWKKPREWTLYYMVSSHTDIGLHNSPYIQRDNSVKYLDKAIELNKSSENRYHYVMEGTWYWNNYGMDKGNDKAQMVADEFIKTGKDSGVIVYDINKDGKLVNPSEMQSTKGVVVCHIAVDDEDVYCANYCCV